MKVRESVAASAAMLVAAALPATMVRAGEAGDSPAVVITLSADDALERGMAVSLVRHGDHGGVALYDRVLIEDDGPGINSDAPWQKDGRAPTFEVIGPRRIKKVLYVDRPEALSARLYLRPGTRVQFNGHALPDADTAYPEVPINLIRKGDNEVVLIAKADTSVIVKAAARSDILRNDPLRSDRPGRSFVSTDAGGGWAPFDGEFMVRLHLVQYAAQGSFVSPVLDASGDDDARSDRPLRQSAEIRSIHLKAETQTPTGTSVHVLVRSGASPVYETDRWSDWRSAEAPTPAGHRYLQWQAILSTSNPQATPVLKSVTVEANVARQSQPDWAGNIAVRAWQNPEIRYTSIPFAYEDPRDPKLVALRQKYKLDDVVAGSKTELEKFVRLRNWVAQQWKYKVPDERYPAWDADEILTGRFGFCVQYAIVYMQCAISLGYQTRFVFANHPGARDMGHEVCEVWSNEYGKWVYMDSADNFHYVDAKTGVPLSMLETHDLMLRTYYGDRIASREAVPKQDKTTSEMKICYGLELEPTGTSPSWTKEQIVDGLYPISRMWMTLRYMPRNNYCSQPYPVPMRQGSHWDWSDYWVWEGPQMPRAQWLYRNFTARRADLDWTINQVRFDAACGERPDTIDVQMGTVTPGFETFLVNVDDAGWQTSDRAYRWQLRHGKNRLSMRVRTASGVEGSVSFLELDN